MRTRTFFLALGAALILSDCGGGGGSGATGSAPVPVSTLSPITATNAGNVAGNAYAARTVLGESSSLTNVLTGVSVGGTGISTVTPVLNLIKHAQRAPQLLTGVTTSDNCTGGGTVTIDATMRSQQTISNGDTMKVTANNCVEDGSTLNGTLSIAFSDVTGDMLNSVTFSATLDTSFSNFSVASGSDRMAINGDMKIAIIQTNATTNSLTISGKSLETTEQKSGTTVATRTLTNYSVVASTQGTTVTSAANFTMSGNTSTLGQFSYTVTSLQPFVSIGSAMPTAGSLIVKGASSSVTVTAGASGVRLDYSAKGDGTITQTTTQSWTEFLASI